jgi:long-subunit fatty acid transport protein
MKGGIMKSNKITLCALFFTFVFLGLNSQLMAQFDYDPFIAYESITENDVLPGARAAGMGGAQIAAGLDGSSIWYNPALLTRIRTTEVSGTLMHQKFYNETTFRNSFVPDVHVSNSRLGSLWGVFPLTTYQGGMTIGFAINRIKSFDRIFRFESAPHWLESSRTVDGWGGGEDESGSLWAVSLGGAVELSPKVSVGLSLDIFDGNDDWSFCFDSTYTADNYMFYLRHEISDDISGVSGKIGITYDIDNAMNISGIIGFPSAITVDQESYYTEYDNNGLDYEDFGSVSYDYTLPFWFGLGARYRQQDFTITGDVTFRDYSQLEYTDGLSNLPEYNFAARRAYDDAVAYRIGGEYIIRPANIRLRAGYYQETIPFNVDDYEVETQPSYFTLGTGFIIDRALSLDFAYLRGNWEKSDNSLETIEQYRAHRFMMSISYRM